MELDPAEVLQNLNAMGYKDITPQQLKAFMKDLKKLIAFEAQNKCGARRKNYVKECLATQQTVKTTQPIMEPQEKITSRPSSRVNSEKQPLHVKMVEEPEKNVSRPCSRASSKVVQPEGKENLVQKTKMWIRTAKPRTSFRNDPVELYQMYQKEWQRHKQHIPGENDHSELRWQIRNKLLGG